MPKARDTEWICENCKVVQSKWYGKCPNCGEFNNMIEQAKTPKSAAKPKSAKHAARNAIVPTSGLNTIPLSEIRTQDFPKILLHSKELNTVLGGDTTPGLTPGSSVLLGGAPGAGKSTMAGAIAGFLAQQDNVLYASAEESPQQIKQRMDRMSIDSNQLYLMSETNLENILTKAEALDPILLIVDSIQMIYTNLSDSSPGTITQVRECASLLNNFAKTYGINVLILSQMTKNDDFAGPRQLEHIVDTTLYLEGDENGMFRVLRSIKNRFGPSPETGFFEMSSAGFIDVPNPSDILLSERNAAAAGTTIAAMIDGSKAMLVEVQALVSDSDYANPSRNATGFDRNRVSKIADVLTKHAPCEMSIRNIMVNIVGGIVGVEPALDMPMAIAMLSSFLGRIVPGNLTSFGEIGLTGEVRSVARMDIRVKEAKKIGMKHVIIPASKRGVVHEEGMNIIPIKNVRELIEIVEKFPSDGSVKDKKTVKIEATLPRSRELIRNGSDQDSVQNKYLEKPIP